MLPRDSEGKVARLSSLAAQQGKSRLKKKSGFNPKNTKRKGKANPPW